MFLLCLKIFFVRIIDVSLATVMTIFVIKGKKTISAIIGFIDILIWFLIAREALTQDSNSIYIAIAYAGGFATGTYIGAIIAERFVGGNIGIQVFTSSTNKKLLDEIRKNGYAVSVIDCRGINEEEKKYMLYININRKKEKELRNLINKLDEEAFIVVSETMRVQNGYFQN
jgi:uncharacterized protein YebE (UPF0316 family)